MVAAQPEENRFAAILIWSWQLPPEELIGRKNNSAFLIPFVCCLLVYINFVALV